MQSSRTLVRSTPTPAGSTDTFTAGLRFRLACVSRLSQPPHRGDGDDPPDVAGGAKETPSPRPAFATRWGDRAASPALRSTRGCGMSYLNGSGWKRMSSSLRRDASPRGSQRTRGSLDPRRFPQRVSIILTPSKFGRSRPPNKPPSRSPINGRLRGSTSPTFRCLTARMR